jgi:N-carbamoyl-L-amino-acid hydrolase
LLGFVRDAIEQVTSAKPPRRGKTAPELPSGPLHDAAEMAAIVPTAMVFAMSSPGVSHTRIEDTPRSALDKSIRAFLLTVDRTVEHFATQAKPTKPTKRRQLQSPPRRKRA